jgi:hypothetical protein
MLTPIIPHRFDKDNGPLYNHSDSWETAGVVQGPGPSKRIQGTCYMPRYDRLSILVSLVLFGLVVSHLVELPTRTVSFVALGVPTTIYLSSRWLVAGLLVTLTGAGVDSIVRSHPQARRAGWGYGLTFWGLPCSFVLLSSVVLPLSPSIASWLAALAVTGLVLSLLVLAQSATVGDRGRHVGVARWGSSLAVYAAVFVFCTLIYGARARSLLSATAISVLATSLALELLRPQSPTLPTRRSWIYALVVGLVLGEVSWALNHLSFSAVGGGIFLLLIFYVVCGLAKQHLTARLSRPVIAEFVAVSIVGLGLLYLM